MRQCDIDSAKLAVPKVLACAATGVVEHIKKHHGDVASVFDHSGIAVGDIDSPVNELLLNQFCALFTAAAKNTHNDNFGLEVGSTFKPEFLGPLGYLAICSPTLLAAIKNVVKYFPAHQGLTSFGMMQDSDVIWLYYRIDDKRIEQRRQDAELSLGIFCNIFRAALGEHWSPLEVRFEHTRPDNHQEHESVFGAPIEFHRRTNAFAFRRDDLATKMPGQDSYLFSIITSFFDSHYTRNQSPQDLSIIVRDQIRLYLGNELPTVSNVAKILGLPDFTLRRQLKNRGLLFSGILRAARQELALHYMEDGDIPLTSIAYDLGYSELSAFSRAFRSWTGMSPHRYRKIIMNRPSN